MAERADDNVAMSSEVVYSDPVRFLEDASRHVVDNHIVLKREPQFELGSVIECTFTLPLLERRLGCELVVDQRLSDQVVCTITGWQGDDESAYWKYVALCWSMAVAFQHPEFVGRLPPLRSRGLDVQNLVELSSFTASKPESKGVNGFGDVNKDAESTSIVIDAEEDSETFYSYRPQSIQSEELRRTANGFTSTGSFQNIMSDLNPPKTESKPRHRDFSMGDGSYRMGSLQPYRAERRAPVHRTAELPSPEQVDFAWEPAAEVTKATTILNGSTLGEKPSREPATHLAVLVDSAPNSVPLPPNALSFQLDRRGLALILSDLMCAGRTGWVERTAPEVQYRVRLERGDVIQIEQRPRADIRLLQVAVSGLGFNWDRLSPVLDKLGDSDVPELIVLQNKCLTPGQAVRLMERRVSIQLARLIDQGWAGKAHFVPDEEMGTPPLVVVPALPAPLPKITYDSLRSRGHQIPMPRLRQLVSRLLESGISWKGNHPFPLDEVHFRDGETQFLEWFREDPNGALSKLKGAKSGQKEQLICLWSLLQLRILVAKAGFKRH